MTRYGTGLMTMLVTTDTAGEAINFEQISSVLSIGLVFSFLVPRFSFQATSSKSN